MQHREGRSAPALTDLVPATEGMLSAHMVGLHSCCPEQLSLYHLLHTVFHAPIEGECPLCKRDEPAQYKGHTCLIEVDLKLMLVLMQGQRALYKEAKVEPSRDGISKDAPYASPAHSMPVKRQSSRPVPHWLALFRTTIPACKNVKMSCRHRHGWQTLSDAEGFCYLECM